MILAAGRVNAEVLQALVDAGADVKVSNIEGQTALMNAAINDDLESVRLLIMAGAAVNAKNKEGDTAWDQTSNDEIKVLLVSFGAETHEKTGDSETDEPKNN